MIFFFCHVLLYAVLSNVFHELGAIRAHASFLFLAAVPSDEVQKPAIQTFALPTPPLKAQVCECLWNSFWECTVGGRPQVSSYFPKVNLEQKMCLTFNYLLPLKTINVTRLHFLNLTLLQSHNSISVMNCIIIKRVIYLTTDILQRVPHISLLLFFCLDSDLEGFHWTSTAVSLMLAFHRPLC